MRVLVTGGAGFVGSHLVEGLVGARHDVRVLDDFSTGHAANLQHLRHDIDLREGTILDQEGMRPVMDGVEVVLHQAAIPSVPRSVKNPVISHEVNSTGTLNVLLAAREAGVRRVIYAASSSAYGAAPGAVRVETMPASPLSPYAVAKLTGEHYCQVFARIYSLETICLRYFNVFGPRQDPGSEYSAVIPRFMTAVREGRPLTIYGDGSQTRDFTYVGNVVRANLLAMTAPGVAGEVMNIGGGHQTSLNELVYQIRQISGKTPSVIYAPARCGEVLHSLADITKARLLLGYEPTVTFACGLEQTWDFFDCQTDQRAINARPAAAVSGSRTERK